MIGMRLPDQRHPGGQSVGAERARHGQRAQVEQIDEIGVGAKVRVAGDKPPGKAPAAR